MSNKRRSRREWSDLLDRVPLARDANRQEEYASAASHAAGVVGSLVAIGVLIHLAVRSGNTVVLVATTVFGFSLLTLYTVSTIYHFVAEDRIKRLFRVLDHVSVLYLIAGSYTIVLLLFFHGLVHWVLLSVEWGLALVGTVYKVLFLGRSKVFSIVLYLAMGWLAVIVFPQMLSLQVGELDFWLLLGGVLYTSGLLFFGLKRLPYNHMVWHLFVMAGTACQIIGIFDATKLLYG